MRWIALILLVAVIAAAAALYGMVTGIGEAEPPRSVAAGTPVGEGGKVVRRVPDWAAMLERYAPPAEGPAVAFTDGEGRQMTLADFKGQGLVVNLWATWCAPCVREMPSLNRLQAAVADEGIRVIAVSSDREGLAKVAPFLEKHALDRLAPYLDPKGDFTRAMPGGTALPRTFIINADGAIAASYTGPAEWDAPDLVAAVREMTR